jgi:hypothetical protein
MSQTLMSQTLTIPNDLHSRLAATARRRGFPSVEKLLEYWQQHEDELHRRREVVSRIDELRQRLQATQGEFSDSTDLLREDRSR